MKVLRSVLYMPSSNVRALEKAKTIATDGLIFDLEDAVAPDAKEEARGQAVAAAQSGEYGHRVVTIRANGLDTQWGRSDLEAIAQSQASAVVIPKVSSTAHLDEVSSILSNAGAPDSLGIWAMLETPEAIADSRAICAHPRVEVLVMGTNDLYRELHAQMVSNRHPIMPHLASSILAAREAGKIILDGVYNNVRYADGFLVEAQQGYEMGFDGKTLVHPNQVEPTNSTWAPSEEEIDYANRVIVAFDEAQSAGLGVVTVDGKMIENLHVDAAKRALAISAAIEAIG